MNKTNCLQPYRKKSQVFMNEGVLVKSHCIQKRNVRMFIVRRNVIYALY